MGGITGGLLFWPEILPCTGKCATRGRSDVPSSGFFFLFVFFSFFSFSPSPSPPLLVFFLSCLPCLLFSCPASLSPSLVPVHAPSHPRLFFPFLCSSPSPFISISISLHLPLFIHSSSSTLLSLSPSPSPSLPSLLPPLPFSSNLFNRCASLPLSFIFFFLFLSHPHPSASFLPRLPLPPLHSCL